MAYCTQCSEPLRSGVQFCPHCGAVVGKRKHHVREKERSNQSLKSSVASKKTRKQKQSEPEDIPKKRVNRRALIIKAGAKSLGKSLALSAAILGPGLVLLSLGYQVFGMIWLFFGSFGLMAWTYRKPWRLGLISCLMPPVAAALCYLLQLGLFGSTAPPLVLLIPAIGIGVGVGYWRARTHEVKKDEQGGIIAQRTIGYLLVWVAAYGITQMLGLMAAGTYAVRAGLVTGAFSTAMLAMVSLVIWRQFNTLRVVPAIILFLMLFAPFSELQAKTENKSCYRIAQSIAGTVLSQLPMKVKTDELNVEASNSSCFISHRVTGIEHKYGSGDLVVSISRHSDPQNQRQKPFKFFDTASEGIWVFSAEQAVVNGNIFISSGISVETYVDYYPSNIKNVFRNILNGINAKAISAFPPSSSSTQRTVKDPRGEPNDSNKNPKKIEERSAAAKQANEARRPAEGRRSNNGGYGGEPTPPPPDPGINPETAAKVIAAVSAVLVAAGIAINVAQAIAAAIANALQAGVQFTSEEIQHAVVDAQLGDLPEPEYGPPPPKGPDYYDKEGEPFERNEEGEYWAPDDKGNWRWLGEKDAREAEAALRGENIQRQREIAHHNREAAKDMERSRAKISAINQAEVEAFKERQRLEELEKQRVQDTRERIEENMRRRANAKGGELKKETDELLADGNYAGLEDLYREKVGKEIVEGEETSAAERAWERKLAAGETVAVVVETVGEQAAMVVEEVFTGGKTNGAISAGIFQTARTFGKDPIKTFTDPIKTIKETGYSAGARYVGNRFSGHRGSRLWRTSTNFVWGTGKKAMEGGDPLEALKEGAKNALWGEVRHGAVNKIRGPSSNSTIERINSNLVRMKARPLPNPKITVLTQVQGADGIWRFVR